MSYTYHGTTDLIALPNRTVQTFPSGLVRVERSFVCRKDQVARYRNTIKVNEPMPFDNGAPAIDGLYIFPEPQEVVRDDGFVEFRVTAYGRTNIFSEIAIQRSSIKSEYSLILTQFSNGIPTTLNISPVSINEIYILRGVLPSSDSSSDLLVAPQIEKPLVIPEGSTTPLVAGTIEYPNQFVVINSGTLYRFVTTQIRLQLDAFSSTNLGLWSEYSVTWRATASVSDSYR